MTTRSVLYSDNNNVQSDRDEQLNDILANKIQDLSQKAFTNKSSGENHRTTIAAPLILNDSNFAQAVQKYPLLVVDFWAPWCGPCRILSPTIEQLAKEFAGKVMFGKLNVDENEKTAAKYGIRSIPTLILFQKGEVKEVLIGNRPKNEIVQALDPA